MICFSKPREPTVRSAPFSFAQGWKSGKGKARLWKNARRRGEGALGMSSNSSAIEGFLNGAPSPVIVD